MSAQFRKQLLEVNNTLISKGKCLSLQRNSLRGRKKKNRKSRSLSKSNVRKIKMSSRHKWPKTSTVRPLLSVLLGRSNVKLKRWDKWVTFIKSAQTRLRLSNKTWNKFILTKKKNQVKKLVNYILTYRERKKNSCKLLMLWTTVTSKVILFRRGLMRC